MSAAKKLLILENTLGQKVRTFAVDSEALNIVYLTESRRIEAVSNLQTLIDNEINFRLLQTISMSSLTQEGFALKGLGRVRLYPVDVLSSPAHELPEQKDEEELKVLLKKTTIGHLVAVAVLMMATWTVGYFTQKEEPTVVTIALPQKEVKAPVEKRAHVKVSEKKIKPSKKVYRPVAKAKPKIKSKAYKVNTVKAVDVNRVGALAALGGVSRGAKNAEGLDMNSLKNIRSAGAGRGGGGVGGAGRGGIKGYMPGQGLIAGSSGEGAKAQGAGGYGTRGTGGGRAGYGKINMVGGTSATSLPLDDEATVEGGLDRDQIIAVINRNRGQIIYCYEKGLQAQPNIGGRVAMDFTIGPAGRITMARVANSSLQSSLVENCMLSRLKSWQFPRPVGKVNVDVLYPFELMRVSSR
ncbi:hypothetical protein D3C87_300140 [compost metagenome]